MTFSQGNFVFVGGIPRSGTTLVQNILDSHPNIVGGPEFTYLPNIVQLRRTLAKSVDYGQTNFYLSKEYIDAQLSALIISFLSNSIRDESVRYISEKTPWNILIFKDLLELMPESKFIQVVRHPYDVFQSMKRVSERAQKKKISPPDFVTDVLKICFYIEASYYSTTKLRKNYGDKILPVRYEDVVAYPEQATKAICKHLHIHWHSNMLNPGDFKHPGESATVNEVWYTKVDYQRNIHRKKNHQRNIQALDKRVLELIFEESDFAKEFNYKFERTKLSFWENIKAGRMFRSYRKNFNPKKTPIRVL